MKKLLSILTVLFVLGTTSAFAKGSTGIGAQFGYTVGGGTGAALTFKVSELPCVFAANMNFGGGLDFGVTADWWIKNPKIDGTWGYYYGVGLAGSFAAYDDWASLGVGARALLGTNVKLVDNFIELYAQAAWQPEFWINTKGNGTSGFNFGAIPVNIGFRFWF